MAKRRIKGLNRSVQMNIGLIVFIVLFCYICYSAYSSFKKNPVNYYEVVEGGMAKNTEHEGIIIRTESPQSAQQSGYINLFIQPGKRVGVGTEVYSIDETGAMNSYLAGNQLYDFKMTDENAARLKKNLSSFSMNLRDDNISSVYAEKSAVNTAMIDYAGFVESDSLAKAMEESGISYTRVYSPLAGTVSYKIDGYEERTPESISGNDFNNSIYSAHTTKSGQLIEAGTPVYKIITEEKWDIVFPLSEEEREAFSAYDTLKVSFKGSGLSADAVYTQLNNMDGKAYGKLTLGRYMVDFINDRYISFNIKTASQSGLKIPKSSVVTKTFLLVPADYLAHGGDNTGEGFYKEIITDSGTSIEYIPTDIYYSTDDYYYIDFSSDSPFQPGDYVVKPGSTEHYKLGETATREGVYNINKGYAVFKQIEILDSNDEYYSVKKNQKYGLVVYDHILLDPTGVSEGDFIYE